MSAKQPRGGRKARVDPQRLHRQHVILMLEGPIDHRVARQVYKLLEEKVSTPREATGIDLWLDSYGGDAHSAYKLVLALRHYGCSLRVVVPDVAKSAATLIALGADVIFMGPVAELGPLDVQIQHPDKEQTIVSGLNVADSLDFLSDIALKLIVYGGADVLRNTQLPRNDVLGSITSFTAEFLRPAVEKLDPHLIHRATKQLEVAERYAISMLGMRQLSEQDALDEAGVRALLERLVRNYPAHEFVISRDEAREMKLPVRNAETYPHWAIARAMHEGFFTQSGNIIDVLDDNEIAALKSQAESRERHVSGESNDGEEGKSNEAVEFDALQAADGK